MIAPRLDIDLGKIHHNALHLVELLGKQGIAVTGVTKVCMGSPVIANALLQAGVSRLGDSRVENLRLMKHHGVSASKILIRSPMISQVNKVVRYADVSFNTELEVVSALSESARNAGRQHGVVLMVELGDLREGILPVDVEKIMASVLQMPNIRLAGIGTNLACRSGVIPDAKNMAELSLLTNNLEATFGYKLDFISGGNSANLDWVYSGGAPGRVNDLRLGESIFLGREPLHRRAVPGLYTTAITLVAEVIESKIKPSMPKGKLAQSAFGAKSATVDKGPVVQSIVAIGCQDIDPAGLRAPQGIKILDASSDHLILGSDRRLKIGSEVSFQVDYSALLRAMTSPFVCNVFVKKPSHRFQHPPVAA